MKLYVQTANYYVEKYKGICYAEDYEYKTQLEVIRPTVQVNLLCLTGTKIVSDNNYFFLLWHSCIYQVFIIF